MTSVNWTTPRPFGVGTTRDVTLGLYSLAEYFFRWDNNVNNTDENKRFSFCMTGQVSYVLVLCLLVYSR